MCCTSLFAIGVGAWLADIAQEGHVWHCAKGCCLPPGPVCTWAEPSRPDTLLWPFPMRSNDLHLRKSCTPAQSLQQLWLNAILLQVLDNENAFRPLFYMTLPLIIVLEIHKILIVGKNLLSILCL